MKNNIRKIEIKCGHHDYYLYIDDKMSYYLGNHEKLLDMVEDIGDEKSFAKEIISDYKDRLTEKELNRFTDKLIELYADLENELF